MHCLVVALGGLQQRSQPVPAGRVRSSTARACAQRAQLRSLSAARGQGRTWGSSSARNASGMRIRAARKASPRPPPHSS